LQFTIHRDTRVTRECQVLKSSFDWGQSDPSCVQSVPNYKEVLPPTVVDP